MAVIGSLAVNIVATTDKFISGLNSASTGLGRFVSKIGTVQNAVAGLAIGGFAAIVKGAVDAGSAIHDLSQKLKISTEALGALHFAAEQLGASASSVDNALAFMSKTLGLAAQGSNAATEAFQRLGLQWQDIASQSVDQQFLRIVDAINRLPTASEKAAAAQQIFGRGAKDLSALISAGTAEIVKFGDEAARTGAILSTEQAASLDDASDSILAFSRQWQAMTQQLVSVFAPAISGAFFVIAEGIKMIKDVWNTLQFLMVGGAEIVARSILGVIDLLNIALPKFAELSRQDAQVAVEELARTRRGIVSQVEARHGGGPGGPLKAPPTGEQMERLITATTESGKLAVAGVR